MSFSPRLLSPCSAADTGESPLYETIGKFKEHIQKAEKHANQKIKGRCIFKIQIQKTPLILSQALQKKAPKDFQYACKNSH